MRITLTHDLSTYLKLKFTGLLIDDVKKWGLYLKNKYYRKGQMKVTIRWVGER